MSANDIMLLRRALGWGSATGMPGASLGIITASLLTQGGVENNGTTELVWRPSNAQTTVWAVGISGNVTVTSLGPIGTSWTILNSGDYLSSTTTQMLTDNTASGTMTLWWVNNGTLTGDRPGQLLAKRRLRRRRQFHEFWLGRHAGQKPGRQSHVCLVGRSKQRHTPRVRHRSLLGKHQLRCCWSFFSKQRHDLDLAGNGSVSATAEDGGAGYVGSFMIDALYTAADEHEMIDWQFGLAPNSFRHVTQTYDIDVASREADGTGSIQQPLAVTIGAPGTDTFILRPGFGTEVIANLKSSDTIELDDFSSISNASELRTC